MAVEVGYGDYVLNPQAKQPQTDHIVPLVRPGSDGDYNVALTDLLVGDAVNGLGELGHTGGIFLSCSIAFFKPTQRPMA